VEKDCRLRFFGELRSPQNDKLVAALAASKKNRRYSVIGVEWRIHE